MAKLPGIPKYKILNFNRIEVITEVKNVYDLEVLKNTENECMNEIVFIGELIKRIETSKEYRRGKK